jgi:hypothetical protein
MYSNNHHLTIQRLFDTSHVHATPCGPNSFRSSYLGLPIDRALALLLTHHRSTIDRVCDRNVAFDLATIVLEGPNTQLMLYSGGGN